MSIATAITNAQGKVANAYTAISNKGGTLPVTQNLSNMPTAIDSIPTGADRFRTVNASGQLIPPENDDLDLSDVTSIPDYSMYYIFRNASYPKNVDLSNLVSVSQYGMSNSFYGAGITRIDLTDLAVADTRAFDSAFRDTPLATIIGLDKLKTVGSYGFSYAFYNCPLTAIPSLERLETVATYGFQYAFAMQQTATNSIEIGCTSANSNSFASAFTQSTIGDIVFTRLETATGSSCFYNMLNLATNCFKYRIAHMFPKLRRISGGSAFRTAFRYCRFHKFIFDSLEDVAVQATGNNIFDSAFEYGLFSNNGYISGNLGGVYFPVLKTIGTTSTSLYGMMYAICRGSNATATLDFPELTTAYNTSSTNTRGCFTECGAVWIYMPKLTNFGTYSQYCFYNSTATREIHFGKENQATIQAMSGYSSKFGATNATIYFDLINHITVGGVVYDRYGNDYDYDNEYYSWKNGNNVIYTKNEWTPAVGDTVYTKSDDTYVASADLITAVS